MFSCKLLCGLFVGIAVASVSGSLEFNIDGLPPNSCYETYPGDRRQRYDWPFFFHRRPDNRICNYTFHGPNRLFTQLPLKCVLNGTLREEDKSEYKHCKIQFGTNNATVTVRGLFFTISVLYEIPLKHGYNRVECTITWRGTTFQRSIIVNIHYIPPTTVSTTESSTIGEHVEIPATPPTQKPSTTDVTQEPPRHSCPAVTWPIWTLWLTLSIAVLLFVILVLTILKCRKTAKKLEDNENQLRLIEESERELASMAQRAPAQVPTELLYESVYAHGAGLLRRPKK